MLWLILIILSIVLAPVAFYVLLRRRAMDIWLPAYAAQFRRRTRAIRTADVHVLLCIADHFETRNGSATDDLAHLRLARWLDAYPHLFSAFKDSDGRPPRHTFFYPIEQYDEMEVDALAGLCRLGFGELEIHLHHDNDTAENLRRQLQRSTSLFAEKHGVLARHRMTGRLMYGFVHGNWALDNSRPDGRWCGVSNELDILRETGCYADFTMPSAPSRTQTRKINSIYYAIDDPQRPKSHDHGRDVGSGPAPAAGLMLIQGPLALDWRRRRLGFLPRIENACIQGNHPPTMDRLDLWLRARVQVPGRPDWFFVKLHTHGGPESNQRVLLGEPMVRFHEGLAERARRDPRFHYHYVTAREMYNLAKAAEAGFRGSVAEARDYELLWNGARVPGDQARPRCRDAARIEHAGGGIHR